MPEEPVLIFVLYPSIRNVKRKRNGKIIVKQLVRYYVKVYYAPITSKRKPDRVYQYVRILDAVKYFFTHRQALLGERIRITAMKRKYKGKKYEGLRIEFYKGSERIGDLFHLYIIGLLELRSKRRASKLAKCISLIDPVSPVIDDFHKLLKDLGKPVKMKRIIQAYCGLR